MKKKIIMAIMAILPSTISAQWTKGVTRGDELRGTVPQIYYEYSIDSLYSLTLWPESMSMTMKLHNTDIFNLEQLEYPYPTLCALYGLYDIHFNLIERGWITFTSGRRNYQFLMTTDQRVQRGYTRLSQKKRLKSLMTYLLRQEGYVRMIFPLYSTTDLELHMKTFITDKKQQ